LDSSVSIVTRLRAGVYGVRIPAELSVCFFSSSPKCRDRPWGSASLLFLGTGVFAGAEAAGGRKVGQSPPSLAKVKNEWSHTSYFPIRLHNVDSHNVTFLVILGANGQVSQPYEITHFIITYKFVYLNNSAVSYEVAYHEVVS